MKREDWKDDMGYEKRGAALLLNRERRDLLAKINPESIEPFSHHYMEMERLNELQKRLARKSGEPEPTKEQQWGTPMIAWADEILVLSASGNGWRAGQVENVERSHREDTESLGEEIDMGGRGLKHRDRQRGD